MREMQMQRENATGIFWNIADRYFKARASEQGEACPLKGARANL